MGEVAWGDGRAIFGGDTLVQLIWSFGDIWCWVLWIFVCADVCGEYLAEYLGVMYGFGIIGDGLGTRDEDLERYACSLRGKGPNRYDTGGFRKG